MGYRSRDQLTFVDEAEPVVERRPAEAVAVRDLDHRHAGTGQSRHHRRDRVRGELVTLGVRTVAECRIRDPDVQGVGVGHQDVGSIRVAIASPTRTAAAVMMSRLPA